MGRVRDVLGRAPIIDTLLGSSSKKVRNSTMELLCSSLDLKRSEFKKTVLSDVKKYSDLISKIENENKSILLSWVEFSYKEKISSKKLSLVNGGIYPIIISVIVTVTFLYVTGLIFNKEVSEVMKEPLLIVVGALAANFNSIVQFFLGSSLNSISKENTIRDTLVNAGVNRESKNTEDSESSESYISSREE